MLSHKISGLPVTDAGKLVGITTSDILLAFLDVMGASEEGSFRIHFLLEQGHDLALASKPSERKEERSSVWGRRERWDESRV
jgi:hypothetical protein